MSKNYLYQFNEKIYETREEAEEAAYYLAYETYDDMLDETYEEVSICGHTYPPSVVLKRTDEIAYRCGLLDYTNYLSNDIKEIEVDENEYEIW